MVPRGQLPFFMSTCGHMLPFSRMLLQLLPRGADGSRDCMMLAEVQSASEQAGVLPRGPKGRNVMLA